MKFITPYNFLLYFFFYSNILFAQEIEVRDSETGFPLSGVLINNYNKSIYTVTDENGYASLSIFKKTDIITIQIYGYKNQQINLKEKDKFIIYMDGEEEALEEVILSVARSKTSRKQIAEKVNVISSEEISLNNPSTGGDILKLSPGIRLQKSQGGGGSPVLRGFEANRVLLVVDGVRMNNAIYRTGHLQNSITIDPNNIERVEVIFGSSSVGYGSDALGGVIHYYTKSPRINNAKKFKTSINSQLQTANNSTLNNFTTELSFKKWASLSSVSFSDFGNIKIGKKRNHGYKNWGLTRFYSDNNINNYNPNQNENKNPNIQKNTNYNQLDILQKFSFLIAPKKQLLLNFQFSKSSNIPRYDKLIEEKNGNLKFAEWSYGPQQRLMIAPQFKFFSEKKFLNKGSLIIAYQNIRESRIKRKFSSLDRQSQEEYLNLLSVNGDFDFNIKNHSFSYGFEGTYNDIYSIGYSQKLLLNQNKIIDLDIRLPITSRYPSSGSSYKSIAAYINWIWDIEDNLTLSVGMRLTRTILKAKWKEINNINSLLSNVNLNSIALTETLGLTYRPKKNIQWSFIISSGFRNPNIDDIGKVREQNGFLLVPNSFLKPEYAYNFETGFTKFLNNSKDYISLRGFTTLISRHIVRSNYSIFSDKTTSDDSTIIYNNEEVKTLANKNLGNRYIFGGSFDCYFTFTKNIFLKNSITITEGNKNKKYGPLPSISPIFGFLSINYRHSFFKLSSIVNFSGSKDPEKYSFGGEDGLEETPIIEGSNEIKYAGTPSWYDFSIIGDYIINKKLKINFGAYNLFDFHYREFGSGISAPGRNIQIGLNWEP
ncbi:MAG: TonB-dependent receptor domain-containing protein [Flavobacteriaceae bacterium]